MRFTIFRLLCFAGIASGRAVLYAHTLSPVERDLIGLFEEPASPTVQRAVAATPPSGVPEPLLEHTTAIPLAHITPPTLSATRATSASISAAASETPHHLPLLATANGASPTTDANHGPTPSANVESPGTHPSAGGGGGGPQKAGEVGYIGDAGATPPAELRQWKVIGIGVMTVTMIAILILAVSFFDSWWAFVRDVACCSKRRKGSEDPLEHFGGGEETLVPDWEKRGWEVQLANEGSGHRYPTMASLESIVKDKERRETLYATEDAYAGAKITSPEPVRSVTTPIPTTR